MLQEYYNDFIPLKEQVKGVLDIASDRKGQQVGDYTIYSLDDIKELNPDLIILTVAYNKATYPKIIQNLTQIKKQNSLKYKIVKDLFV